MHRKIIALKLKQTYVALHFVPGLSFDPRKFFYMNARILHKRPYSITIMTFFPGGLCPPPPGGAFGADARALGHREGNDANGIQAESTLPSLKVDLDPGGYLEDLGAILEVLAPMVITI